MGAVLHRVTKELRQSVHAPDYPDSDWIHYPELNAVAGLPVEQWVIEGDTTRAANEGELATINATNLAAAKSRKCAEIDTRSGVLVTSGLEVASGKVISTSMAATQNLQDIALSITLSNATFPQAVSTLDGGVYSIADVADFVRIAGLLKTMKKTVLEAGQALRAEVLACETIEEVNAVEDSR